MDESVRFAPVSILDEYLKGHVGGVILFEGSPAVRLRIDPVGPSLSIQVQGEWASPELSKYENLSFRRFEEKDGIWSEMSLLLDRNTDEAYSFICAIADRVQLKKVPFDAAIEETLVSLLGLLASRRGLSGSKQVGLFGELLVLSAMVECVGPSAAIESWRGWSSEEHDFGLPDFDLEVKTTRGEKRMHWISSLTQLQPTVDRPLLLASIQITAAGLDRGWSLPGLVDEVRTRFGVHSAGLEYKLVRAGYRDVDAELYRSRWTPRTQIRLFSVEGDLPRITATSLQGCVPGANRILEVNYRIDLIGTEAVAAPEGFKPLLSIGGSSDE